MPVYLVYIGFLIFFVHFSASLSSALCICSGPADTIATDDVSKLRPVIELLTRQVPKEVPASAGKGGQGRRGRDGTGAGAGRRAFARTIEPAVLTAVSAAMKDWDALDKLRASQA